MSAPEPAASTRKRRRWDNADAPAAPAPSVPAVPAPTPSTPSTVSLSAAGAAATAQELKRKIDERLRALNVPVPTAPVAASPTVAQQVAAAQQQIAARMQGVSNPMIAAALQATQGLGKQERKIHGIRMDEQGRLVDAEGNLIEMAKAKVPELLANRQKDKVAVKEEAEPAAPAPAPEPAANKYFDPSLDNKPVERKGRQFHFVKEGKFVHQAQSLRMKQLSREMRQRVRSALAETSEVLAAPSRAKALIPDAAPEVEWWDQELINGDSYAAPLNESAITAQVLHPVPLPPVAEPPPPPPLPLMLTQKEKDKLRRQRKQQEHKEKTDMIRFGLVPAPEPKMTLKNMYRVLEHDATINPSALEKKVRQQMAERVAKHEKANEDRKLTPEQRREKKRKKLAENTETEVHVAVFKATDLKAPQVRFKVDVTAQQYNLTGCAILFPECNAIVVEGGPKGIKKFTRMLLERIKWDMIGAADSKEDEDANSEEEQEEKAPKSNKCFLVWQGVSDSRKFKTFRFENCISEAMSRKYLADKGLGHFWDFAKQFKPEV